jgi:nucleobase:cation symporter-1, NCS1 family
MSSVESRSIDFIPPSERYGTPRRLFTIWFSANMTVLGVGVGTLGVVAGLSFWSAVVAIAAGNAIGTLFMAAHSAQGPQLGIPQMIQSRAQFGVRGAGVPLVAVVITYLLYCAADVALIRRPIQALLPVSEETAMVLFAVATLAVAYAGYELIHRLGAVLTVVSTVLFATAAALMASRYGMHFAAAAPSTGDTPHAGLMMMTQAAAWGLSYGPYVADYSRYLPAEVPASKTFWYTASSCWLSSTLIMTLGAYIALILPQLAGSPGDAIANVFVRGRLLVEVLIIVGLIQGNVMNLYSAYMSTITIVSGVRGMPAVSRLQKFVVITTLIGIATVIAAIARQNFNVYFGDMLSVMIYMLIPWSAINLMDYYVVRKGRYNIPDMFRLDGIYGAYRWPTIAVYLIGIVVQLPFVSLSFWNGPIERWLGSDFAWVPGLLIPAVLYLVIEKQRTDRTSVALP